MSTHPLQWVVIWAICTEIDQCLPFGLYTRVELVLIIGRNNLSKPIIDTIESTIERGQAIANLSTYYQRDQTLAQAHSTTI